VDIVRAHLRLSETKEFALHTGEAKIDARDEASSPKRPGDGAFAAAYAKTW
jgi:hypothetical protein